MHSPIPHPNAGLHHHRPESVCYLVPKGSKLATARHIGGTYSLIDINDNKLKASPSSLEERMPIIRPWGACSRLSLSWPQCPPLSSQNLDLITVQRVKFSTDDLIRHNNMWECFGFSVKTCSLVFYPRRGDIPWWSWYIVLTAFDHDKTLYQPYDSATDYQRRTLLFALQLPRPPAAHDDEAFAQLITKHPRTRLEYIVECEGIAAKPNNGNRIVYL